MNRLYMTEDELNQIAEFERRAYQRKVTQAGQNGVCPCRCRNSLNDDGSNTCRCCNEPQIDIPDDLI